MCIIIRDNYVLFKERKFISKLNICNRSANLKWTFLNLYSIL